MVEDKFADLNFRQDEAEADAATENSFSAHVDQNPEDLRPHLGEREIFQGVFYMWPASADGSRCLVRLLRLVA